MKSEVKDAFATLTLDTLTSGTPAMQRCLQLAKEAARTNLPILLLGESGTGKTLLAQAIHNSSLRHEKHFLSFNAAAMNDTLLESQLFGHEKGAFTGATGTMHGKFELADGGTLFFDEIADMSPLAQAKILRAVEYGEYERLGSEIIRHADVRIISASNRSLRKMVADGKYREDLYHRLNGITLVIPPLRKRQEDLPGLIAAEVKNCALENNKEITAIDPDAFDRLMSYPWPGNLRELHRMLQAAVIFATGPVVKLENIVFDESTFDTDLENKDFMVSHEHGHQHGSVNTDDDLTLEYVVLKHIQTVMELTGGNKSKAARLLDITRVTLDKKLKKIEDQNL